MDVRRWQTSRGLQLTQFLSICLLTMVSLWQEITAALIENDGVRNNTNPQSPLYILLRGGCHLWDVCTRRRGGGTTSAFNHWRRTSASSTPLHRAGQGCSECPHSDTGNVKAIDNALTYCDKRKRMWKWVSCPPFFTGCLEPYFKWHRNLHGKSRCSSG